MVSSAYPERLKPESVATPDGTAGALPCPFLASPRSKSGTALNPADTTAVAPDRQLLWPALETPTHRQALANSSGRMCQMLAPFRLLFALVSFISEGCKVDGLIEELVEQTQELETPQDFQRLFAHAFQLQEVPEILFRHHECPTERTHRDSLLGAATAERQVHALNIFVSFSQQPIAEVLVNLACAFADLVRRNFSQISRPAGAFQLVQETFG